MRMGVRCAVGMILVVLVTVPLSAEPLDVLVLHSYHDGLPWVVGFRRGLRDAQSVDTQSGDARVRYFTEYLDASRTGDALDLDAWIRHLQAKYGSVGIDAIIAEAEYSVALVRAHPTLFGSVPQVGVSPTEHDDLPFLRFIRPQIAAAVEQTVRLALDQNPDADTATIIDGGNPATPAVVDRLTTILSDAGVAVNVERGFTLAELQTRLARTPASEIAFYTLVFRDADGTAYVPARFLEEVTRVSNVPVYTFWGTLTGTGVVGGSMVDARVVARQAVKAVRDYVDEGRFQPQYATNQIYVDWRAMERYGIDPRSVPADAVVLHRPEPFFVAYYVESVTVASVLFFLALVVMVFLFRRNLAANRRLREQGVALQDTLDQKAIMYQEMNNRIKNNLAILSSVITLQIDHLMDDAAKAHLKNIVGRLQTLALVHEELSGEGGVKKTNAREYLRSLVLQVHAAMTAEPAETRVRVTVDDVLLENRDAVATGLIVHELLTNALKFAFPENAAGTIEVELTRVENRGNVVFLSVADDGVGLPDGFDPERDAGLGLSIVQSLARQLGGSFRIHNESGVRFSVEFSP